MTRQWKTCTLSLMCGLAATLPTALAQHQAAPKVNPLVLEHAVDIGEPQFGGIIYAHTTKNPGSVPALRGTTVVYDTITTCTGFSRLTLGPAAILDDGSFTPGPASLSGATISEIDFFIRPLVALPTIVARITVFNTIDLAGQGSPLIVQSQQIFSETYVITGTAANTTPGLYQFTADVTDFMIADDDWGIEIAFLAAPAGAILANGVVTTSFPGTVCAPTMPQVGGNAAIFWADNDLGPGQPLIGDGIRYEPYDAAQANVNQGDALAFGAGTVFNGLGLRFRGLINDPTLGACCLGDNSCIVSNQENCDLQGGTLTLQQGCSAFFCLPAPANDDCLNAQVITGFGTFSYDNRAATATDPAPTCGPLGEDVWFRWQAPCSGDVSVSTCLLNLTDDLFAVYQGSNCGDLNTQVACDDDGCGVVGGAATATFSATAGTTYLIRMGTFNATVGAENFFEITNVNCSGGPAFCDADWCQDGTVGVPDIFCFLSAWFANDPVARNYGGNPGVPAIFAFLSIWFATGTGPCTP